MDRKVTLDFLVAAGEKAAEAMAAAIVSVEYDDAAAEVSFSDAKYRVGEMVADFLVLLGEARAIQRYILVGEPDPRMPENPSEN